jgi:hypothetical protein
VGTEGVFILVPMILILGAVPFSVMMVLDVRSARKQLLGVPRLTVREVRDLDRLPKRVALQAQTGPGAVKAPLSGVDCAWYRLEAGRMETVGSNEGEVLQARYTETAPKSRRIPLVDAAHPQNVLWLDERCARQALDRKLTTLIAEPVREVVAFHQSAEGQAGWAYLSRLEAEGHLTAEDLAPGGRATGLGVFEFLAPADTPVLVIGRPVRRGDQVAIQSAGWIGLSGTTTGSDPEIEARLGSRARFWRWMLTGSVLATVAACWATPALATAGWPIR